MPVLHLTGPRRSVAEASSSRRAHCQTRFDKRKWIDPSALHPHPPMQMGGGDAAGSADPSDDFAVLYDLAPLHVNAGEVRIKRIDAETVVQNHGISGEEQVFREDDATSIRRM